MANGRRKPAGIDSWSLHQPAYAGRSPKCLYLRGHLEALAIFACQHGVGFLVAEEGFLRRIERQLATDATLGFIQADAIVLEMLFHALEGFAGILVLGERLGRLAERLLLAETIADVAQVTQRTGQMAFENVGVEIRSLAAADGLDEVAEMILAAAELLDNLALGRVGDGTTVARTNH